MSDFVDGIVDHGVVIPSSPLPEGARVEIHLLECQSPASSVAANGPSPGELRRMPREQRQVILAAAAALAEQDYQFGNELTGFEAFSEEELNDDESNTD